MPKRKRPRRVSGNYADVASALDDVPIVRDYVEGLMDALRIPRARWWNTPAQEYVTFTLAAYKVGELVDGGLALNAAVQRVSAELGMRPRTLSRGMSRWREAAGVGDMMSDMESRDDGILP